MTTQSLKLPEGRIAYDSTGSGPLVVAIPSMGDLRAEYRFLAPQLSAAGYRVVSMDVRGHGESDARWPDYSVAAIGQDVVALVRALDAGPAILIGDSMAAGAAVWAAAEAPELVNAMVLLGPVVRGEVSRPFRFLLAVLFARPWGPSAWKLYFDRLFPMRKPQDHSQYTALLKRNLSEPGRMEALGRMMVASKQASEDRVKKAGTPTLVIMGTKDPDFKGPAAEARWLAGELKAQFQMIEGVGHYPHVEMPEVVGPRIVQFLKALKPVADGGAVAHAQGTT